MSYKVDEEPTELQSGGDGVEIQGLEEAFSQLGHQSLVYAYVKASK